MRTIILSLLLAAATLYGARVEAQTEPPARDEAQPASSPAAQDQPEEWDRRDRAGLIAGSVIGGPSFLLSLIAGAGLLSQGDWIGGLLLVPVLGALSAAIVYFVEAADRVEDGLDDGLAVVAGVLCLVDGLFQAMATVFLTVAYVRHARRRSSAASSPQRSRFGASLALSGPGGPGLTLAGWF